MSWKTEKSGKQSSTRPLAEPRAGQMGANCTSEMATVRSYGEEKEQPVPSTTGTGGGWEVMGAKCQTVLVLAHRRASQGKACERPG